MVLTEKVICGPGGQGESSLGNHTSDSQKKKKKKKKKKKSFARRYKKVVGVVE